MSSESPDDIQPAEGTLRSLISIESSLFALLASLVFFLYTLRLGYAEWFALCAGGLASLLAKPGAARRTLTAWVAWLAYGAAARHCGFYSERFDPWLSVLPIACMLASHLHPHREAERLGLALCACLPASSAVAPELPFAELAIKSALFGAAFFREEEPSRCAWILYAPLLSPVFWVGVALFAGLSAREKRAAPEQVLPDLAPAKKVKKQGV